MTRLVYTRRAEDELRGIWRHIAERNEPAANRILISLIDRIEMLRRHPRLGPRRPEIRASARILVEGHYLILYELHPDDDEGGIETIEVVSIVDGRRDLEGMF